MLCHTPKYNLKNQISIDRPLKLQTKNLVFVTSPDQHFCRGVRNWSIDILMRVMVENEGQRRSQVSLVGGADRIPGGGINLNTYTYKMSRRAA